MPRLELNLEKQQPHNLASLFPASPKDAKPKEIWLEIGFGGGEHLLAQAKANPGVGLLGAEPFIDGVAKVVSGIA
ncbi:MAG: tRNA (guanosine(46)-N7)-methyltransferase TrmB, partial [Pseudomonadota bacterium]